MISETYVEVMVAKVSKIPVKLVQGVCLVLAIGFGMLGLAGFWPGLFIALFFGAMVYLAGIQGSIEYEYIYVDKELQIDKILGKSRRKRVETLDLNQMEILAPLQSHSLDAYRNRSGKAVDYSTGVVEQPDKRYAMYLDGARQIIFEPNEAMVKAIQAIAPRKVFTY